MVLDLRANMGDGGGAGGVGTTCERVNSGRSMSMVKTWEIVGEMDEEVHVVMGERRSSDWMGEGRKQAVTDLLYGLHKGGQTSTVVSWLCVVHKRVAIRCCWRLTCVIGNLEIESRSGHGRQ